MAAALAVTLLVAACGGSTATTTPSVEPEPSPTPAPTVSAAPHSAAPTAAASVAPLGTTGRIVDDSNGYAITLPDGWVRIDLTQQDVEAVVQAGLEAMSPEAADLLVSQISAMTAAGMKFFAIDRDGATLEYVPNVNILSIPTGGLSLNLLEQTVVAQLEGTLQNVEGEIESERVALPAGESLRITYVLGMDAAGVPGVNAAVHQFLILGETTGYFVTVSGPNTEEFAAEALAIASTFELLE